MVELPQGKMELMDMELYNPFVEQEEREEQE